MAKPTEASNVEVGAPLQGVIGGAGAAVDVVGRAGSTLMASTLLDLRMMDAIVNHAQTMGALSRSPMEPGTTTVASALGSNADAYGKTGSDFASTMADHMMKFGVVTTLMTLGTMNSGPAPDVVKEMQAEEDRKKAAIALDQAHKAEGIAEDDRKRTSSLTTPKM